jgi:hypothetical protein
MAARRSGVVLTSRRAATPARLAAWSIGRASPSGIWNRTDRGLETAPDARAPSYLWLRNTVNSVASRTADAGISSARNRRRR